MLLFLWHCVLALEET